jgi:hypothetical protein
MPYAPRATTVGGSIGSAATGAPQAPAETLPIGEQLMHVDQAITLTLQEIDANFARAHQCVTGRILPAVKHYGVASARTWQGARVSSERQERSRWHEACAPADAHALPAPRGGPHVC